jgi:hypothetical protein
VKDVLREVVEKAGNAKKRDDVDLVEDRAQTVGIQTRDIGGRVLKNYQPVEDRGHGFNQFRFSRRSLLITGVLKLRRFLCPSFVVVLVACMREQACCMLGSLAWRLGFARWWSKPDLIIRGAGALSEGGL